MSYLSWPSTILVEMKRIRKSEPLYFFSHLYWNKISHIQHCVRLRRTTWWFNICIYCEIITTVRLVSTSINLQIRFLCVRTKIYSLSNFKVYNKVLLAIVTMLYVTSPEFTHLITGSLYPLNIFTHLAPAPQIWQPPTYCLFLWQFVFFLILWWTS